MLGGSRRADEREFRGKDVDLHPEKHFARGLGPDPSPRLHSCDRSRVEARSLPQVQSRR